MLRRLLIHLLARFRKPKPTGYELPQISSPYADSERMFVASHRMAGARVDYTEQSLAYLEQVAHKLLQWHPEKAEEGEEAALTKDEWLQQADRFITMGGSYLGSVIIMQLGGQWSDDTDRDDLSVEGIGSTEISVYPFRVVSDRILKEGGNLWRWYRSLKEDVGRKQK